MKVICRHHKRDGTVEVYREDFATGEIERLTEHHAKKKVVTGPAGSWQHSLSCAVPLHQKKEAEKLDVALGVQTDYVVKGQIAYAEFRDRQHKNKWQRLHEWVDHDACYSDPAPGDFADRRAEREAN